MTENKMLNILHTFGVKTHRINGRNMAEMPCTQNGVFYIELVEIDTTRHTVEGMLLHHWLGYDNLLQMMRDYNRERANKLQSP